LLQDSFAELSNHILGNPHSDSPTANYATQKIEEARQKVLEYFNAQDDYCCVFTQNATGALKIVGECYPFDDNGGFLYCVDNHNSVLGIRNYAAKKNAAFINHFSLGNDFRVEKEGLASLLSDAAYAPVQNKLLAFPAQSNATGIKHGLEIITIAKNAGWDVLLDAAAYVPTNMLDLGALKELNQQPDYVCVSFYKMFGYPTGVGCLLIKIKPENSDRSPFGKLWNNKPWGPGGTVTYISSQSASLSTGEGCTDATSNYVLYKNHRCFEEGTPNFQHIPAVKRGLEFLEHSNKEYTISAHVAGLMGWIVKKVKATLYTGMQQPVAIICGAEEGVQFGSTVFMKFYHKDGRQYWNRHLEGLVKKFNTASNYKLSVRIGSFCNPGVDEVCSGHDMAYMQMRYEKNRTEYNYAHQHPPVIAESPTLPEPDPDIINGLGNYPGGLRVSVGIASNFHDVFVFGQFVEYVMSAEG
jgi:selenocysteine lyase/cysteine desulfurase